METLAQGDTNNSMPTLFIPRPRTQVNPEVARKVSQLLLQMEDNPQHAGCSHEKRNLSQM